MRVDCCQAEFCFPFERCGRMNRTIAEGQNHLWGRVELNQFSGLSLRKITKSMHTVSPDSGFERHDGGTKAHFVRGNYRPAYS